ncbi:hypothetical protein EYF80_043750 [Liparis tanakae]|uniref:Uncharacterized protein n=1 Tax=Liparis tanakae TaxID=230148 RepID=A0A4Z2FYH0_9TELE|nr:hypothetical protein EYF80_043750 [Liparis tanakae]
MSLKAWNKDDRELLQGFLQPRALTRRPAATKPEQHINLCCVQLRVEMQRGAVGLDFLESTSEFWTTGKAAEFPRLPPSLHRQSFST